MILSATNTNGTRGIFRNHTSGLFVKSGGDGTTTIGDVDFYDSQGTIEVQSGIVDFASGFVEFDRTEFIGLGTIKISNDIVVNNILSEDTHIDYSPSGSASIGIIQVK